MTSDLVNLYLSELERSLGDRETHEAEEMLADLRAVPGASDDALSSVLARHPGCPDDLLALLGSVDGTYGAEHAGSRRLAYVLNSDVAGGEYPYYLLSCEQILASGRRADLGGESIADTYGDEWEEWLPPGREAAAPGEGHLDDRIDPHLPEGRRLHFADCMNNGGTSRLYLDFDPVGGGMPGQVVRFLHDPDSYAVIADSFSEHLALSLRRGFGFVDLLE